MRRKSAFDEIYDLDEPKEEPQELYVNPDEPYLTSRHKKEISDIAIKIIFIILIVYVVFLIIGAVSTEYYTDENGDTQIVVGNITVLENRDDYDTLTDYVKQVRDVMVDITIIDIKLANGFLSPGQAAVLYNEILDDKVDLLIPKVKTLEVKTRNELIKQNIQVILSNDIAFYLQLMIAGLQQQNSEQINNATSWKSSMMITYNTIEASMLELAKTIHRENNEFFEWELEEAVVEKDSTAVLLSEEKIETEEGSEE